MRQGKIRPALFSFLSLRVHPSRLALEQILQEALKPDGLEIRVQLLAAQVTQILGILGCVIPTYTPGIMVLAEKEFDDRGKISRALRDRFTCRGDQSSELGLSDLSLLLSLVVSKSIWTFPMINQIKTYIVPLDLLPAHFFHQIIDLVRRDDLAVRKDHPVEGSWICDNPGHVASHVGDVRQGSGHVAVPRDVVIPNGVGKSGVVCPSGWQFKDETLVPPADVDDGVRKTELFDVVQDVFFLYMCCVRTY